MKRLMQLFFLFFIAAPCVYAQKVPENLYSIKNPSKDYDKRCNSCKTALKSMPNEVKYGTFAQEGYIYFVLTDPAWYPKLFEKNSDGIAIDLIKRSQYACGKKNLLANSWAHHGFLMKPMYKKEMDDNLFSLDNGSLLVKYAPIPEGFKDEELEFNLLLLKDRYLCHYSNFYDLRGEKWKLLEMGLFMDTLTESILQSRSDLLSKEWRFEIPFEKNKSDYAQRDVKAIYDSLLRNDFIIKSISIKAYSSVEGSSENNLTLQEKRAQSIVKALQSFQIQTIYASISASENWVEFMEDISTTKYTALKSFTKEEIKLKLENKQISADLEPFLRKHRKAILHIELEKKISFEEDDAEKLQQLFNEKIVSQNSREAIELQQVIFSKIKENKLPHQFLATLEIPEKATFGMLLQNKAVFNYRQSEADLFSTLTKFSKLLELMPGDLRIRYNLCVLQLQAWVIGQASVNPITLKSEISALEKSGIDPKLIKRMLINFHIILSEYQFANREYAEKDKTLKYVGATYQSLNLSDKDALSLSQYFVAYHKYEWAEKLLLTYAMKLDVEENLLFYYLNLTIALPKTTSLKSYRTIMLNAINVNRTRYCTIFNAFGQGGISFQLLDNDYLKKTYCENCP